MNYTGFMQVMHHSSHNYPIDDSEIVVDDKSIPAREKLALSCCYDGRLRPQICTSANKLPCINRGLTWSTHTFTQSQIWNNSALWAPLIIPFFLVFLPAKQDMEWRATRHHQRKQLTAHVLTVDIKKRYQHERNSWLNDDMWVILFVVLFFVQPQTKFCVSFF
jgi:hypothetical protein